MSLPVHTDVVSRVRNGECPPFRPTLKSSPSATPLNMQVVELMRDCWEEDANKRPKFSKLVARLNKIFGGE